MMQSIKDIQVRSKTVKKAILNLRLADRNLCAIKSAKTCNGLVTVFLYEFI